jgi:hypothetical protein
MKAAATIAAVDALDHVHAQLGALRAIESLAMVSKVDSEQDMGTLQRNDLAMLLCLVTTSIAATCTSTRAGLTVI